jgi:hypothetical protein
MRQRYYEGWAKANGQIGLGITSRRLDEWQGSSLISASNNFVPDIIGQNIVIFRKCVNRADIRIE